MPAVNPEDCEHTSINRVADRWSCNNCGAEFIPKHTKHFTHWKT